MAQELENRLKRLSAIIRKAADVAKINALNNLEASYKTRIFTDGKRTSGGAIGSYSTTATYVSIAGAKAKYGSQLKSSALSPKGKNGASKFKNGKSKKSEYFADGYAGFRNKVGRQSEKIDFNLTGNLKDSIVGGTSREGLSLGYLNSDAEVLSNNLERRFGEVFAPTDAEVEEVLDNIENTIFDAILREL